MFLKLKTLHFLDLIHIAIFVCVQQKKSITCKVLHSTAHGFSHSICPVHMSWVHFLLPLISSSESIVSISNLAHLHSGECRLWLYTVTCRWNCTWWKIWRRYSLHAQLEILRRNKKKWFLLTQKRSSKRSSKQLLDTRSKWSIYIVGRFRRSRGRSAHGWSFRLL